MLQGAELEPTPSIPISGWLESTDDDFISDFCWFISLLTCSTLVWTYLLFQEKGTERGLEREREETNHVQVSSLLRFSPFSDGSSAHGILQARTLEWVAISFSNAGKWKLKVKSLSRVRLFATPWTAAYQAPLPMGFSKQEYWSRVPLPFPKNTGVGTYSLLQRIFLDPGIEPRSPALRADSLPFEPSRKPNTFSLFLCFLLSQIHPELQSNCSNQKTNLWISKRKGMGEG